MSDIWGHLIGVVILILMAAFIGIWIWAWRPRHKPLFRRMARLPLERDERPDQAPARHDDSTRDNDEGKRL